MVLRSGKVSNSHRSTQLCTECGAHCCSYGGAVATPDEVKAIVASGYPDHFVKVSETVRITEWGPRGDCPYLADNACSIYEVRPLRCRAYPVFQMNTGEVFLSLCPLGLLFSDNDVSEFAALISQCPRSSIDEAYRHLRPHSKDLEKRLSRFKIRKVR